eukprot:Nk52_evm30s1129 gene=Nk52_evmTU30s1129
MSDVYEEELSSAAEDPLFADVDVANSTFNDSYYEEDDDMSVRRKMLDTYICSEERHDYEGKEEQEEEIEEKIEEEEEEGGGKGKQKCSVFGCVLNMLNILLGTGILALPYAYKQVGGYVPGTLIILVFACLSTYSAIVIVLAGVRSGAPSWHGLAYATFGEGGRLVAVVIVVLGTYATNVSYLVVVGDCLVSIAKYVITDEILENCSHGILKPFLVLLRTRAFLVFLCSILFLFPACLLRRYKSIALISFVSVASSMTVIVVVGLISVTNISDTSQFQQSEDYRDDEPASFFKGLSIFAFAFSGHSVFPLIFTSMRKKTPGKWVFVSLCSVFGASVLNLALALSGYHLFGDSIKGNVLLNFDETWPVLHVLRLLIVIALLLTFPLENAGVRDGLVVIFSLFRKVYDDVDDTVHVAVTITVFALTAAPGCLLDDIGTVLAVTGATIASFTVFILPGMLNLKSRADKAFSNQNYSRPYINTLHDEHDDDKDHYNSGCNTPVHILGDGQEFEEIELITPAAKRTAASSIRCSVNTLHQQQHAMTGLWRKKSLWCVTRWDTLFDWTLIIVGFIVASFGIAYSL